LSPLLQILLTVSVSIASAWLSTRLALHRFYREKAWERKTTAYTAIFEALHDMNQWFVTHMDAYIREKELLEPEQQELSKSYREAKARLARRLDSERWLLPQAFLDRMKRLDAELAVDHEDWFQILDEGQFAMTAALDDLRSLVQEDLGLSRPAWRVRWDGRIAKSVTALERRIPWKKQ